MKIEELSYKYILIVIAVILASVVIADFIPIFMLSLAPLYKHYGGDNSKAWWVR